MPSIKIPEEALADLKIIAAIDGALFDSLLSVFRETAPTLRRRQFEDVVAAKVPHVSREDLHAVLTTVFFLYSIRERGNFSPSTVSAAVIASLTETKAEGFPEEAKTRLQEHLQALLSLDKSLGVTAKALDVLTEHDKIFCKARILSDIRPVFSVNTKEASAAVIVHNLQIGFHRNGEHEDIYIALDTDDVQRLKEVIDRADEKATALKALVNKAQLPYLEV